MVLTPVTAVAVLVGVTTILVGAACLRSPLAVHDIAVRYLGSERRDPKTVRRGALVRGLVLLALGALCLVFVAVSV